MSLNNASILESATISVTGGTALDFSSLGGNTLGQNKLVVPADVDFKTRRSINCVAKEPRINVDKPNGYTQARQSAVLSIPRVLDNGLLSVDTIKVEIATDVETTVAEKQEMLKLGAQICTDSDFADFLAQQILV